MFLGCLHPPTPSTPSSDLHFVPTAIQLRQVRHSRPLNSVSNSFSKKTSQNSPEIHWQIPHCYFSFSGPHSVTAAEFLFGPYRRARVCEWIKGGHVKCVSWPRHHQEAAATAWAQHAGGCGLLTSSQALEEISAKQASVVTQQSPHLPPGP